MTYELFGYWRSSASWRVRIALGLKGLEYTNTPVNLLENEQGSDAHAARNPMKQLPVLVTPDGPLTQSLAIVDWLDRAHPEPALYPASSGDRARALALAEIVNAGIQPLQNLKVLLKLQAQGVDRAAWGREAIQDGLEAFQALARTTTAGFSVGDTVTVADLCLVPQLYNARRFDCDLSRLSLLTDIEARCADLPAFQAAHPDNQPDARRTP